jgi:hypothetical protein
MTGARDLDILASKRPLDEMISASSRRECFQAIRRLCHERETIHICYFPK